MLRTKSLCVVQAHRSLPLLVLTIAQSGLARYGQLLMNCKSCTSTLCVENMPGIDSSGVLPFMRRFHSTQKQPVRGKSKKMIAPRKKCHLFLCSVCISLLRACFNALYTVEPYEHASDLVSCVPSYEDHVSGIRPYAERT